MFRRILVASDLTEASRPALRTALHLGCLVGSSVVALYVIDDVTEGGEATAHFGGVHALATAPRDPGARREEQAVRLRLERQTRSEIPAGHSPPTEAIVRIGPVAETIIGTAEAGEADLVVVGAGRRNGSLGSVAAHVARMAGRPVLAVPPEKNEGDAAHDRQLHDPVGTHERFALGAYRRS